MPAFLNHKTYGFTDEDLTKTFELGGVAVGAASAGVMSSSEPLTLGEILDTLKMSYCRTVGVEFTHISDLEQQNWIRNKFEVGVDGFWDPGFWFFWLILSSRIGSETSLKSQTLNPKPWTLDPEPYTEA